MALVSGPKATSKKQMAKFVCLGEEQGFVLVLSRPLPLGFLPGKCRASSLRDKHSQPSNVGKRWRSHGGLWQLRHYGFPTLHDIVT